MKKTKSKAKGSVKRRRYSADERALYLLGQWDSRYAYPKNTRCGRLLQGAAYHPSYVAGKADGKKRKESDPRYATTRRVPSKKEPKIGKELASFLEDVWSNPYDK